MKKYTVEVCLKSGNRSAVMEFEDAKKARAWGEQYRKFNFLGGYKLYFGGKVIQIVQF